MKKKLLSLISLLLPLTPLLLFWIPWYSNIISGELEVENSYRMLFGWEVIISDGFRVLISFLFCFLLQCASIKEKNNILSIIGELLLIFELTIYTEVKFYPFEYSYLYFIKTFSMGYYLSLICLIVCIAVNIIIMGENNNAKINQKSS